MRPEWKPGVPGEAAGWKSAMGRVVLPYALFPDAVPGALEHSEWDHSDKAESRRQPNGTSGSPVIPLHQKPGNTEHKSEKPERNSNELEEERVQN